MLDNGLVVKQARVRGRNGQPSVPIALDPDGAHRHSAPVHQPFRGGEGLA